MTDERRQREAAVTCTWTEDGDGNWDTRCGETFVLIEGTPRLNHYRFCPSCGGEIETKPFEPNTEE